MKLKTKILKLSKMILDIQHLNCGGCSHFALEVMRGLDYYNVNYKVLLYRPTIVSPNKKLRDKYKTLRVFNDISDIQSMGFNQCLLFYHIDIVVDGIYINDKYNANGIILKYSQVYNDESDVVEIDSTDTLFKNFQKIIDKSTQIDYLWNPVFEELVGAEFIYSLVDDVFKEEKVA